MQGYLTKKKLHILSIVSIALLLL